MIKKIAQIFLCIILILSTLLVSSCGEKNARMGTLKIVATFFPLYITALNLTDGIDEVEVINLTDKRVGGLHDYQLTQDNMKTLSGANVLIINGSGLEKFVDWVKRSNPQLKIIDATSGAPIGLLQDKNGVNSLVWMNIDYNIEVVNRLANELAKIDAAHASNYRTNARLYIERLQILKNEAHIVVDELKNRDVVTFNRAFPYFAKEFNLHIVAELDSKSRMLANPETMEEIIDEVNRFPKTVILTDSVYAPDEAEMIAYKTGAQIYTLDPILSGEAKKDAYIEAMRKNAVTLRQALR